MIVRDGRRLRHEFKFTINMMDYYVVRNRLSATMETDIHAGLGGKYHIRSLYFDDFRDSALFDKQSGTFGRTKYRMRIYNHSDKVIKFERKNKFDQYVSKESTLISHDEADRIIAGDISFLADSKDKLLRTFYLNCRCNLLRPKVIVDYEREAYIYPVGDVRITFDTNLSTGINSIAFFDPDATTIRALDEPCEIMEIKYDSVFPAHIKGLLPNSLRPRLSMGKFSISRKFSKYNEWEDQ